MLARTLSVQCSQRMEQSALHYLWLLLVLPGVFTVSLARAQQHGQEGGVQWHGGWGTILGPCSCRPFVVGCYP